MSNKKKSKTGPDFGLQQENILEAVVVADSFDSQFLPVTSNQPKSLLPLANSPILAYTLEFLASCNVKKIYVYCCHCADQVKKYLSQSKWNEKSSPCTVIPIMSSDLSSIGDVFRDIDQKSLFESDFLFVPGDIISNMKLKDALNEHKTRREKDKNKPLITLVMQYLSPQHRARIKENEVIVVSDKHSNQVLHYHQCSDDRSAAKVKFPLEIFRKPDCLVELRYDLIDMGIWICSPLVPPLFSDNFDYQTQNDFIKGILINEEFLGNQIHMHVVKSRYCAKIENLYMYDVVSRDVISRWAYPFVPETLSDNLLSETTVESDRYRFLRRNVYLAPSCVLGHNSSVTKSSVLGHGTTVGSNCSIADSVVGAGCRIGDNCVILGSYIWSNVTIKSGSKIINSLLCDDVTIFENVEVQNHCVLCEQVSIGPDIKLQQDTVICLPEDDGFEGGDMKSEAEASPDLVGAHGRGCLWERSEDADDESVDPLASDLWGMSLHDYTQQADDDVTASEASSAMMSDYDDDREESEDDIPLDDDLTNFQREVKESLHGGYNDRTQCDNLILEINSSKYAYNVSLQDIVQTVTKSMFEIAAVESSTSYYTSLEKVLDFFAPMLCNYNKTLSAQLTCLYAIEEHAASHENVASCLIKILMYLYENDVVSEQAILKWNSKADVTYLALFTPAQIRTKVAKFIQWLIEAEEEDSSDE